MADLDATQPATQQALDPRRVGEESLAEPDLADIICILHPGSPSASRIVQAMSRDRPQHILQNRSAYGSMGEMVLLGSGSRSLDLALRFSSTPNSAWGFIFGRNPALCDVLLRDDTEAAKQISNMHFCICINTNGVLVVEDSSTNGTVVDNVILRGKGPNLSSKRVLSTGSTIQPLSRDVENLIIFHVRIPPRDGHTLQYRANFEAFMRKMRQLGPAQGKQARPLPHGASTLVYTSNRFGMKWDGSPKYKVTNFLGSGAFGKVYQLTTCFEGNLFAVKELDKKRFTKDNVLDRRIVNELNIMKAVDHPNIVKFIDFHDIQDYLYIVMEYVGFGDLQGLMKSCRLNDVQGKAVASQTLDALSYLHAKRITHRDIKPDNILIASMEPLVVMLTDFGLSKEETDLSFTKTFCGTILYCAPEVFPHFSERRGRKRPHSSRTTKYTTAVDIWSLGGVLWFAMCGSPPFEGVVDDMGRLMFNRITTTTPNVAALVKAGVSADAEDLLCKMLTVDPDQRPSATECLEHPWIYEGKPVSQYGPELSLDPAAAVDERVFSQLSLADEGLGLLGQNLEDIREEDMEDVDDEFLHLSSKRVKRDSMYPRNQIRDISDPDQEDTSENLSDVDLFPLPSSEDVEDNAQPRLFGEVGTDALASSGLLMEHARALARDPRQHHPLPNGRRFATPSRAGAAAQATNTLLPSALPSERDLFRTESQAEYDLGPSPLYSQDSAFSLESDGGSAALSMDHPLPQSVQSVSEDSFQTPREQAVVQLSQDSTPRQQHLAGLGARATESPRMRPPTALSLRPSPFGNVMTQNRYAESQPSQAPLYQAQFRAHSLSEEFAAGLIESPPLGTLVSTTDSIMPIFHRIDNRKTTWGRNSGCGLVHFDRTDTRIPKLALGLRFEAPGIEEDDHNGPAWTTMPGLHVLVKNFSKKQCIWVNGVKLAANSEDGDDLCGHLHSGDVITILQPREDDSGPGPSDRDRAAQLNTLRFVCDFSIGEAKEPRRELFAVIDQRNRSNAKLGGSHSTTGS